MPITIAQVSDTHLLADSTQSLRGCYTQQSLAQILDQVVALEVDYLLLTGDLSDQGEPESYHHLRNLLEHLTLPIYGLLGNHDSLSNADQVLGNSYPGIITHHPRSFSIANWQLILLNSVLDFSQQGEGYLTEPTLEWLETELTHQGDRPTLIALHHHPLPVGIDWLDEIGVTNGVDFMNRIDRFPAVKVVLFGHIHWAFQNDRLLANGIDRQFFYGCPSSGLQVIPPSAVTADQYPGFRLITLYENGTHTTEIRRLG